MRERVFRCLDSLGSIVKGIQDRLRLYNKAHIGLWLAAEEVYVALLLVAETMVS